MADPEVVPEVEPLPVVDDEVVPLLEPDRVLVELELEDGAVDVESAALLLELVDLGWVCWVWLDVELDCACSASVAIRAAALELTILKCFFIA